MFRLSSGLDQGEIQLAAVGKTNLEQAESPSTNKLGHS